MSRKIALIVHVEVEDRDDDDQDHVSDAIETVEEILMDWLGNEEGRVVLACTAMPVDFHAYE